MWQINVTTFINILNFFNKYLYNVHIRNPCNVFLPVHLKHCWKKRADGADTSVLFFSLAVLVFCKWTRRYCFFSAFCCENWHIRWMKWHPDSLRWSRTCFLAVFHTILSQISNYYFCAISSCKFLSVLFFMLFPTMTWKSA